MTPPKDENYVDLINAIQDNEGWRHILNSFARFVNPTADSIIVDLGCGPGALVDIYQREYGAVAIGVDYNPAMLAYSAQAYPLGRFVAGDGFALPFATASIPAITATNVLYLLDEPAGVLAEIGRVLKPNGIFVMLNPSPKMNVASTTALADERGLTGVGRDHLINWGQVAEENHRWSVDDIGAMFAEVGLGNLEIQERVGAGLTFYARAIRIA